MEGGGEGEGGLGLSGVPAPLTVIKDIDVLRRQRVFAQVKGNPMLEMTRAHALCAPCPPRAKTWEANPHGGRRCLDSTTPSSPAQGCAGVGGSTWNLLPQHPCPHSCLGLGEGVGVLQSRERLGAGPLSPHEGLTSSLLLGVPVGGGDLYSTRRGPGAGQGRAHPCHSPRLRTNVTLSQSPPDHPTARHALPAQRALLRGALVTIRDYLNYACTASVSASPPPGDEVFRGTGPCLPCAPSCPLRLARSTGPPRCWLTDGKKEGGMDRRMPKTIRPELNHTPSLPEPPLGPVTQNRPHRDPSQPQRPPPAAEAAHPASPEPSLAELPQYCEGSPLPLLAPRRSPQPRGESEGGGGGGAGGGGLGDE